MNKKPAIHSSFCIDNPYKWDAACPRCLELVGERAPTSIFAAERRTARQQKAQRLAYERNAPKGHLKRWMQDMTRDSISWNGKYELTTSERSDLQAYQELEALEKAARDVYALLMAILTYENRAKHPDWFERSEALRKAIETLEEE